MKISQHRGCSCSDCLYHNELDLPSIQLLENGSRINKSSYDKHLPRREKRLFNRLVRTRTKYDDVRNKILADTNHDVNIKRMRFGRNKQRELPDGDNINKETIRAMVDLIDRGEMLPDGPYLKPTKKLSNCCDCCYCNSKIHRLKAGNKFETASSSRIHARHRGADMHRKLKSVKLRTKLIKSDPCFCTMYSSELSNDGFAPVETRNHDYDETTSTNSTIASKALQAKRVICECKLGKLSAESLKKIKTVKDQFREGIRNSISKLETSFRIKKDSLALFRENVILKKLLKKFKCDSDFCIPEDCIPQECFEKNNLRQRIRKFSSGLSIKAYPKIRKLSKHAKKKPKPKSVECHCKPISKSASSLINYTGGITNKKKYETMDGTVDSTVKDKVREGIRSSISKLETSFRIKKDSLALFREKERKRLMKKYECESDYCIPEDCIPQECFEKIKLGQRIRKFSSGLSIKAYSKIRKLSKYAEKKPSPKSVECHCKPISKSTSSMINYTGGITNKKQYETIDGTVDSTVKDKVREGIRSSISKLETSFRIKKDSIALFREKERLKRLMKKYKCESDYCIPEHCIPQECFEKIKLRQRIRKFSSGLSIKAYPKIRKLSKYAKKKPSPKSVECHCKPISKSASSMLNYTGGKHITNKKKYKAMDGIVDSRKTGVLIHVEPNFKKEEYDRMDTKKNKKVTKETYTGHKKSSEFTLTDSGTKPPTAKECLPSMCIPGDCIPKKCAEMFALPLKPVFKKNQKPSKGYNTNETKSEMISSKQNNIKTINSHFSFDIELYKNKKKKNIKREKANGRKRTDSKQYKTKRKASHALKRCFCTLKLKEKHLNQIRAYSKGSVSLIRNNKIKRKGNKIDCQCGDDHRKSTIRNYGLKKHKAASVQSDVCFLDNSGCCDSELCNKKTKFRSRRSRVRHNQQRGQRLKTKTSKPSLITLPKSKHSSSETTTSKKNNINYQQELLNIEQPKSVVRIGSNFSFNIEFYKDNMVPHTNKIHSKKIKHVTIKEPLLKRCFCALRLLKENREKFNKNKSTERKEPKVLKKNQKSCCCQCDITLKKSIRFVNCANKSSNTVMNNPICKSSGTSKSYLKSQMMQAIISEPSPEKTDDITYNELINEQCMEDEKRVVRIGSSFSFNIDFYKQVYCADSNQDKTSHKNNQRKVIEKDPLPVKTKEYAVQTIDPIRPHKKIQAYLSTTDKGMMTNSLLKSCFCALKHNKFKTCKKRELDCSKPVRPQEINKATMTKKYNKLKFNQIKCFCKRNNERIPKYKHYKESGTGKVPEIIQLKSTGTARKFAKSKTQRNQFDFNGSSTTKRIKVKNETCPITPARQAVRISSNFSFGIELNKEKQSKSPLFLKKNEEHALNCNFKLCNSEKKNISDQIKYRQSIFNFMFKQCLSFMKCKQSKERVVIEKRKVLQNFSITSVNNSDKFVFDNRLECTYHNRRLKAKSVIDTVTYRAKRAQWNTGDGISYPNINSKRIIQVENKKLRRRLHKKLYKNPATIDSAFNNSKNIHDGIQPQPRRNYKTEINNDFTAFNDTLITGKEIKEKYLQASSFHHHREYKVGYTLNEAIPAFYTTGFQEQQFNICNIGLSYDDLKNNKIVNPVFTEGHFVPNNVHKKNKLHKKTATSLQNTIPDSKEIKRVKTSLIKEIMKINTKLTKEQSVKNTSNTDNVNQNFSSCQCNIQKYNNQHPKQKRKLKEKMAYDNKQKNDSIQEIIENKTIYSNSLRFQRNENSPSLEKIGNLPDCKMQKQENQIYCMKSRRLYKTQNEQLSRLYKPQKQKYNGKSNIKYYKNISKEFEIVMPYSKKRFRNKRSCMSLLSKCNGSKNNSSVGYKPCQIWFSKHNLFAMSKNFLCKLCQTPNGTNEKCNMILCQKQSFTNLTLFARNRKSRRLYKAQNEEFSRLYKPQKKKYNGKNNKNISKEFEIVMPYSKKLYRNKRSCMSLLSNCNGAKRKSAVGYKPYEICFSKHNLFAVSKNFVCKLCQIPNGTNEKCNIILCQKQSFTNLTSFARNRKSNKTQNEQLSLVYRPQKNQYNGKYNKEISKEFEIIMPYSKKLFRNKKSHMCLLSKCNDAKKLYSVGYKPCDLSYSKPNLFTISKNILCALCRSPNGTNEECYTMILCKKKSITNLTSVVGRRRFTIISTVLKTKNNGVVN